MRPANFQADYTAEKPGSYVSEVVAQRNGQEIGRDVLTFQRMDGVAENFHTEQNRDLLEKLASQTGGRYWRPDELSKLPAEIPYSDAGITMRETKELWNMPIDFSGADPAAVFGMAAAPQVGCGVKRRTRISQLFSRRRSRCVCSPRYPRVPAPITSPWRVWEASRTTSNASPLWPAISISC